MLIVNAIISRGKIDNYQHNKYIMYVGDGIIFLCPIQFVSHQCLNSREKIDK